MPKLLGEAAFWLSKIQLGQVFIGMIGRGSVLFISLLLMVSAFTFIFGRIYCSTVCPLGFIQDIAIKQARLNGRSFNYHKTFILRIPVAVIAVILALTGFVSIFSLFDPYGIFSRFMSIVIHPLIALTLPAFNFHLLAITLMTLFSMILIIVSSYYRGRFYCGNLCPIGVFLGVLNKAAMMQILIRNNCTSCGLCEDVCKAECIDSKNKSIDTVRCVNCFECIEVCPSEALVYGRRAIEFSEKRRAALFSASQAAALTVAAVATASPIPFLNDYDRKYVGHAGLPKNSIIPPGALSYAHLIKYCTGCHECMRSCPAQLITIKVAAFKGRAPMLPQIVYKKGFCPPECSICAEVCPSAAIVANDIAERKLIKYGSTYLDKKLCVAFANNEACDVCKEKCPTKAIKLLDGKEYGVDVLIPHVEPLLCTGCGACEFSCPVNPKRAIIVVGLPIHMKAKKP